MAKAIKTVATVVAGVALVATGVGALVLPAGMSFAFAGVAASTIAMAASGVAAVAGMFVKPPEVPGSQTERLRASIDPRAYRKTVLGSTAMPVDVRYSEWFGKDQERCGWIVALASHRIDGVDEIWFDDERAWSATGGVSAKFAGYFWVRAIRTEGSASTVSLGRWGSNHRLTGCAYAHLEFKVTGNSKKAESPFASGLPSRVTIIGRGAPLYDPRRDGTAPGGAGTMRADSEATWSYSADGGVIGENVALQILRVLIGGRINGKLATGCGVPLRRLDMQSFAVAANLCDELVNRSIGGTEPRFRAAGVLSEGDDPEQLLTALCAACCGRLTDVAGKIGLVVAHNDLGEAASDDGLNTDDVVGPFNWNPDPGMEATPNTVRGRYTDPSPASLYQLLPYPDVTLPQGEAGEVLLPLDLGLVESPSQAQRIAKQALQRKQYQGTFTAPFDIRAWKYRVGQVVPFTFAPLSFERRLFRVIDQEPGSPDQCVMTLRIEHPQIYVWDADDRAAVQAAEPIIYDSRNNPLILAIDEAAGTALWEGVTGDGKPQDGATVGAPWGTPIGDRPVEQLIAELDQLNTDTAAALALATEVKAEAGEIFADVTQAKADILANGQNITSITETLGEQGAYLQETRTVADNAAGQLVQIEQDLSTANTNASQALSVSQSTAGQLAEFETDLSTANANASQALTVAESAQGAVASFEQDLSTVGANVTQNAQAISTLTADLAEVSVEARTGGNPNLVVGGGFENGMADWVGPQFEVIRDGNGTYAVARQNGTYELRLKQRFPVFPNTPYTVSAGFGFIAAGGVVYVDMRFYDAVGNQIKDGGQNGQTPGRAAFATDGTDRQAIAYTEASPVNAVSADARFVVEGATDISYAAVREIKVEAGARATAFNSSASIRQSFLSINGLFARAAVELDVNGYVSGWETNNNGVRADFRIRADKFEVVAPDGGPALQWIGGTLWNRGETISTIIGQDIGTDSDLAFWIGPNRPRLG